LKAKFSPSTLEVKDVSGDKALKEIPVRFLIHPNRWLWGILRNKYCGVGFQRYIHCEATSNGTRRIERGNPWYTWVTGDLEN
jgi:hypothetical protein